MIKNAKNEASRKISIFLFSANTSLAYLWKNGPFLKVLVSVRSLKLHFLVWELQSRQRAGAARLHVNHPLFKGPFSNLLLDFPCNAIWKIGSNDGELGPLHDPGPSFPSTSSAPSWLTTFGCRLDHSNLCQEGRRKCRGSSPVPLWSIAW